MVVIRFQRFGKRFGPHQAVVDLTLEVRRGEVLALLGPNGSGKTTTLKAAAGLIRPTSGTVDIGCPPLSAWLPASRDALSFLPQRVSFPEALTGREVVEFYRALRNAPAQRADDVLRVASLNGASSRPVSTYSGGMVQRLGLAVAALPDAPIFLLDEPTAALDPAGLEAFYALVERYARDGRTVMFTSHQLGDVERLAHRFAVLVNGRLATILTQGELHDQLSARGLMRVRLRACPDPLLVAVREVSVAAQWRDGELSVPGPASLRPAAIEAIRLHGGEMLGLTSEDGRLDVCYRDLTEART
jgi:Cu-processing system ATP-binding protein